MIRKRRKIEKILISLLLVISMVSMMTMTSFAAKQAKATSTVRFRTAVVNQMTLGENSSAEVQRGAEVLPVYEGMRLNKGDIVRTKGNAVLYILVDQDKIIRLDKDTEAELTETLLGIKVKMTLIKGSMFFNVVEKLPDDETLQFVYGNITISIRGTSAEIACDENGAFVMDLADGEVSAEVTSGQGDAEKVQSYDIKPGTKFECACGNEEKGTKPVVKTGSLTLSQLSPSMLAELKKDPQLAERVVSSTPESTGPSGAVYAAVTEAGSLEKIVDAAYDSSVKGGNTTLTPSKEIVQAAAANQGKTVPGTGTGSGSSDDGGNSTPEPVKVTCPGCGKQVTEAELKASHVQLACGHYACQSGDHEKLACGHYACQEGTHEELLPCGKHYKCQVAESEWSKHEKLACGHYGCEEGDHTQLACGHYACESGSHELLPCGEHYKCQVAESEWENHTKAACGHCMVTVVEEGDRGGHNSKEECGHYTCQVRGHESEHALINGDYICHAGKIKCEYCGEWIDIDDYELNHLLPCGHCVNCEGDHSIRPCGEHYHCEPSEDEHSIAECGHCNTTVTKDGAEAHKKLMCGWDYACHVDSNRIWIHDSGLSCQTAWCCAMSQWRNHIPVKKYNQITCNCDIDICLCECNAGEVVECPLCGARENAETFLQNEHCVYDSVEGCIKCKGVRQDITNALAAFQQKYRLTINQIQQLLDLAGIEVTLQSSSSSQQQLLEAKQPTTSVPETAASSEGTEESAEESAAAAEEEASAPVEETSPSIEETTAAAEETTLSRQEEETEEPSAEEQSTAEQETTEQPTTEASTEESSEEESSTQPRSEGSNQGNVNEIVNEIIDRVLDAAEEEGRGQTGQPAGRQEEPPAGNIEPPAAQVPKQVKEEIIP